MQCLNEAVQDNHLLAIADLNQFLDYQRRLWKKMEKCRDRHVIHSEMTIYSKSLSELLEVLFYREMILVDQLEVCYTLY